jgi:ribosomal protein S18 acetylase RimI-like enzyme
MTTAFTVRRCEARDFAEVRRVFYEGQTDYFGLSEAFAEAHRDYAEETLKEDISQENIEKEYLTGPDNILFTCEDDRGRFAGCVGLQRRDRVVQGKPTLLGWELRRMAVDKDHRRMGVSSLLLRACEDHVAARAKGLAPEYAQIWLSTLKTMEQAVLLYSSRGFERVPEWDVTHHYPLKTLGGFLDLHEITFRKLIH